MRTALLLLRPHRRIIFIMMAVCLGYIVIAGLEGKLEPIVLVGVPFITTVLTMVQIRLWESPFPVSNRQLAWIPMGMWAVAMLGSLLVACVMVVLGSQEVVTPMSHLVSLWLLAVLVVCYLRRFASNVVYALPVFLTQNRTDWVVHPIVVTLSPLMVVAIIYLVWEAPMQVSLWRRRDFSAPDFTGSRHVDFTSPVRPILWGSVTNSIAYGVALAVGGYLVWAEIIAPPDTSNSLAGSNKSASTLVACLVLVIIGACFVHIWQRVRASGFTGFDFVWRWLLGISLVGQPFLPYTGVKSGIARRCPLCHNSRLVWMQQCPHCGRSDTNEKVAAKKSVWRRQFMARDPIAVSYRLMFFIMLVLFAGLSLVRQFL